jgi:hypothetical protein
VIETVRDGYRRAELRKWSPCEGSPGIETRRGEIKCPRAVTFGSGGQQCPGVHFSTQTMGTNPFTQLEAVLHRPSHELGTLGLWGLCVTLRLGRVEREPVVQWCVFV